jgi:uncharacterized damage-inducible protein DinB
MARQFRKLRIERSTESVPEVATWLWALGDAHRMLFNAVRNISQEVLDWKPDRKTNTIGTLLYHIAATDAAWLFEDILGAEFPDEVKELFPYDYRNEEGNLWPVTGLPIEEHLSRLEKSRSILAEQVRNFSIEEFRKTIPQKEYETTPEWILYHLAEHENYHRGQIVELRKEAEERFHAR